MGTPPADTFVADTARLRLSRLAAADASFIVELLNDVDFLRYIGDRHVRTEADAIAYITRGPMAMHEAHGFGLDLVSVRETGARAGICGLLVRDGLDVPDIGFAFLPAFRGRGLAREAAESALARARSVHGLTRVAAVVDPANQASLGLLTRLGFAEARPFTLPGDTKVLSLLVVDL